MTRAETRADAFSPIRPSSALGADAGEVVVAVDAMSGDHGAEAAIAGAESALAHDPTLKLLLAGDAELIRRGLRAQSRERVDVLPASDVIPMDAAPVQALRSGRESSMWRALDAVAQGRAAGAVSAGNTGALMTMSAVRLRMKDGVDRPAIAALWPTRRNGAFNVVLDVGANIDASAENLIEFAVMGAEYANAALGVETPRVGLLNVGIEEIKGRAEIRDAAARLAEIAARPDAGFSYVGYVEADRIAGDEADVVVADGFSGNIALKSAEGAARLISDFARRAFCADPWGRAAGLLARRSLRGLFRRIDPRRVNGGAFLGLSGVVVKSHGAADGVGVAAAIELAAALGRADVAGRVAASVAKARLATDDRAAESAPLRTTGS